MRIFLQTQLECVFGQLDIQNTLILAAMRTFTSVCVAVDLFSTESTQMKSTGRAFRIEKKIKRKPVGCRNENHVDHCECM